MAQTQTAAGGIRAAYLTRRISKGTASNDLDQLGIPSAARDQWLTDWDIDLSTHVKTLTEAQIVAAMKKEVLTPDDAEVRLEQLGYSTQDAVILINTAGYKVSGQ